MDDIAKQKARQNLTLVVEEDLLLAARKIALDRRTSVNQLVRDYLASLVEESGRRRMARARLKKAFETGLVEVGDQTWSRDDLYDR
ncbi:MAG: CopG family transcriptional regulator [Bryobacteraceae bacterium]